MPRWVDLIPSEEFEIYKRAGFTKRQKPGKSPALLVIDCTLSFTGSQSMESVVDAIKEYESACGPSAWQAVGFIKEALTLFRKQGRVVVFTKPDVYDQRFAGEATKAGKGTGMVSGNEIVPEVAPLPSEWIVEKAKASCFFGTPLASYLFQKQVDTLVVVGVSTSGCVRASVVDAFSHGFKVFVIEEGCFDRSAFAHAANLFDMDAKYANVMTFEEFKSMFSEETSPTV
ncbi:MAG: isochorismatase family protein [Deltaproteobacteria bacterium]|nr:MAG: isochorismatase family protein [Deltaproteobacteria bacterium]